MKKSNTLALLLLIALLGIPTATFANANATSAEAANKLLECARHAQTSNVAPSSWMDGDPTSDEIVIDFKDDLPNADAIKIGASWGLDLHLNSKYSDDANIFVAKVPEGAVPAFIECMKENPAIEGIEEDTRMKAFALDTSNAPNDPLYQFQWNFQQVNAENAWHHSTGRDVVVAVIDTGVALEDDPDHNIKAVRDLADTGRVDGYDFVDDDDFPWDGHGHGTHVAGTIAQSTNNAYGVAGLAYDADIMPIRVLNSEGYGSTTDIADGIRFAADNGAQVINMSLGGPLPSLVMTRAINYAHKKGVTIIAAAGNSGRRESSYPAAYKHVVAVAATQFDRSTTFYSQWGKFVDIAAPGGNTRVDQNNDGRPDGVMQETLKDSNTAQHEFALYMGTSMASPHVAAIAALVISQGVTNPDKVEEILKRTASNSEEKRYSDQDEYHEHYGAGIIQADKAVEAATNTPGSLRLGLALLLSLFAFLGANRRNLTGNKSKPNIAFFGALLLSSAGLFFLPLILSGFAPTGSTLFGLLSQPIGQWGSVLFGPSSQNPLLASALLPLAAIAILGTSGRGQQLCAGLAIGSAAFCLSDAILMYADVAWIPGYASFFDRAWLILNAAFSAMLGILALRDK